MVALAKAGAMLWLVPAFQAPDEYGHYDYVLYLSHRSPWAFLRGDHLTEATLAPLAFATREVRCLAEATGAGPHFDDAKRFRPLPWRDAVERAAACRTADDPADVVRARELNLLLNHPPLYYAVAAAQVRVLRAFGVNPLVVYGATRLLSVALFVATLVVAWRLAVRLRLAPAAATAATVFVALHPQLSLLSVAVQPDVLGLLLVTATTAALVRVARSGRSLDAAGVGVLVGLLLLTKLHLALPVVTVTAAASVLAAALRRYSWAHVIRLTAAGALPAALVGGWWYARSALLFDNVVGVMASAPHPEATGGPVLARAAHFVATRLGDTFLSYWGRWGWLDFGFSPSALPGLVALSLAPLLGVLVLVGLGLGPSHTRAADRLDRVGVTLVGATFAVFAVEMVAITLWAGPVNDQGRHWLPFVFAQALFFAWPAQVASHRVAAAWTKPGRSRPILLAGIGALASGLALGGLVAAAFAPTAHLTLDLRSSVDAVAEIYVNSGSGFNAQEREQVPLRRRDEWHRLEIPVRATELHALRLDLLAGPGEVLVDTLAIRHARSSAVQAIGPREVVPLNEVSVQPQPTGALRFVAPAGAVDPQAVVIFSPPLHLEPAGWTAVFAGSAKQLVARAVRRLPGLAPWLAGWSLLVVAGVFAIAGALAASRGWPPAALGLAYVGGLAGVLVAITVWLMTLARTFYAP